VVTLLGVLGIAAGLAFAASAPPAPTITSHPASPTTSTTASFGLSAAQSEVTFLCSLDGSTYGSCPSQKSYSGLVAGTHTFSARAQDSHGHTSGTTSFTWTIDTSPPRTSIVFPGAGGLYNAGSWSSGCDLAVCGATTDAAGVASVTVSIRQNSTGKYWNGSAYGSSTESYRAAQLVPLTSSTVIWFYQLPAPSPDGQYTIHVRSADRLGNVTPAGSPASVTFTIDTGPPPAPKITSSPSNPTTATSAQFAFSDGESGVSFQCKLDAGTYARCSTPASYSKLATGGHTFSVRALDAAGNSSGSASYSWTISSTAGMPFTITGNVPSALHPGAAPQTIPLRITNPNSVTIYITALTATVQSTGAAGCTTSWFQIGAAILPSAGIAVAANSSVTVPAANDPTLQMIESYTNQDGCKSAGLTLGYSGSAHS
jgi:hypothetical protein